MLNNIERYAWIFMTVVSGFISWHASYNYYAVKQLKADVIQSKADIQNRDKVITIANQNAANHVASSLRLQEQLRQITALYESKDEENQHVKTQLNNTNHINKLLLRYVGATDSSTTSLSQDAASTGRDVNLYESISPSRYGDWAKGLKEDNDRCHAIHNEMVRLWNKEMELINGFTN